MTSKKYKDNQVSKKWDNEVGNKKNSGVTNSTKNKVDQVQQSNTEVNFAENFNPDDFE
ncbi:hypothetical protein [Defluviitalea saccharophila]|uniref:Uncharacterized protein n=1 Tax=Defluviitalea saccharophila TaxID=879970 RepID=A0ABZ2Y280_9FIRM